MMTTSTEPWNEDPEELSFIGGRVHISHAEKQGAYCLLEASAPHGDEAPSHVHEEDEGFYLLGGVMEL